MPPARAVLAGTVETAVNALWDAAPLVGDRITVVGAGMVGCCVAAVLARFPGVAGRSWSTSIRPGPAVAAALGVDFALPDEAAGGRDLVVHASATAAGLRASLELLAPEGTVIELSWYGDREVSLPLGGVLPLPPAEHPRQPGRHGRPRPGAAAVPSPTGWRWRWTCCAIRAFDALLTGRVPVRGAARRARRARRRASTGTRATSISLPDWE